MSKPKSVYVTFIRATSATGKGLEPTWVEEEKPWFK
jgi:hypothetical protein